MKHSKIIASALAIVFALSVAAPAFAEDGTNANAGAKLRFKLGDMRTATSTPSVRGDIHFGLNASTSADRMEKRQEMGKDMIEKRIKALEDLSARIADMKRLSADQITAIQAQIQAAIDRLTALEATIGSDTSSTTLKADLKDITGANRTFLLVIPQAQISAAVDRILATAGQLENLSVKLSARIDAASTTVDKASLEATLSDMNAKVADAKVQANAAAALVADLKPDEGDQAVKDANTAALKDARAKLEAARADIQAAYKDAQTIVIAVHGKGSVEIGAHGPLPKNPVEPIEGGDNHAN